MKRLLLLTSVLACFVACTDLSGIENDIKVLEEQGGSLAAKNKALEDKSTELSNAVEALKKKSEALTLQSDNLELTSKELEIALDSLRKDSRRLYDALQALQEEGKSIGDSLDRLQGINVKLIEEWEMLESLITEAKVTLDSLKSEWDQIQPHIISIEFVASDNPFQLVENAECKIIGDSVITCRVSNIMSDKHLIPRFKFWGDYVTIDNKEAVSGVTSIDFSKPHILSVYAGEKVTNYTFSVSSYTGLPTLWTEISGRMNVTTAEQYYTAKIKLMDNSLTAVDGGLAETTGRIMAHGTIRWIRSLDTVVPTMMGKNDYSLHFNSSVSLLNEHADKAWQLVSNISDITMLHNQTAFYMGDMSNLEFTPHFHYVDLMMNGTYAGTYMLGDRLDASSARVNVGNSGYILNISSTSSGATFSTQYIEQPVSIIAPASQGTEVVNYISNYVRQAEDVLFSSGFQDASSGWQSYLDMDSFVDWYVINEIAKNPNGAFKSNCIMNLKRGGKLKMGPLWDFEKAFGNASNTSTSGFVIKDVRWFARLFQDPAFVSKVKERFNYFYNRQGDIINEINNNAQYLKYAVQEDDAKWDTFKPYKTSNTDTWELYQTSVNSMKLWLAARMDWLKTQFDAM